EKDDPHYRGDFKGLASRLAYIKELGFTAICVTPPVENRGGLDFMGFNAYDYEVFEPRLSSFDFSWQNLITEARKNGIKVIQTLVVNHCSNYGIRNHVFISRLPLKFYRGPVKIQWPYIFNPGNYKHPFRMDNDNPCAPEWFKDWRYRDPWGAGPLKDPVTGAVFPAENQHPERFFGTDEASLPSEWFHRQGWIPAAGSLIVKQIQHGHLDENSIDLATDNWKIRNFFVSAVKKYIAMGVDGVRIQFARNTDRRDLIYMVEQWRHLKPDLLIFADVEPARDGFGELTGGNEPSELCPWWYTRNVDNPQDSDMQSSGMAVMDYPLFKVFATSLSNGHFMGVGNLLKYDGAYFDPRSLITFFHNYDLGPESGNLTRFSGDTWKAACAYNLLWTMRGVPMLLMGEEVEFMKGMPQKFVLPDDLLSATGKAYFGDFLEAGSIEQTMQHPLFLHIRRLNQLREAVPALGSGNLENVSEFVSGISFIRNHNNAESYAVVGLSAFIDQDITVNRVLPGDYIDAITGQQQTVATSTRSLTFSVKGNSAGIWVRNGPGKIGEDGDYLR
ncbi:MAG: alpha-amylase family glycosyl hydrolase, partial [Candidatus Riflebacteria bacterium]|nr:alpha-amylase family glycosyl hydrolase [Candidatus Riflebacteria bacterium]